MRTLVIALSCLVLAANARAAERVFDFSAAAENKTPEGFRSVIAGLGQPGDWRIVLDEFEPTLKPLTSNAPAILHRAVLAQKSRSILDTHFPILLFDQDTYADFRFSTRFKIVEGEVEQMAGIVFRVRDEKNFYVLRASVKDGTLRFYKMNNGVIEQLVGPKVEFKLGEWRELAVECRGTQIRCYLDGKDRIPMITDSSFPFGKIGFWTKSDSVAYFADARVQYTPREPAAKTLVLEALRRYPRLVGLKIVMPAGTPAEPKVIASKEEAEVGQPADTACRQVLGSGQTFFGKEQDVVHVTLPLRDRNGDTIAVVKVTMKSFMGQTEQNAVIRALPIVKEMQARVQSASDLLE